jgi:hypothetical protein
LRGADRAEPPASPAAQPRSTKRFNRERAPSTFAGTGSRSDSRASSFAHTPDRPVSDSRTSLIRR